MLALACTLQAREFIAGYARAPASTVGSVVLTDLASGRSWEGVDVAEVGLGRRVCHTVHVDGAGKAWGLLRCSNGCCVG
jgi:hypothetical protein